MTRKSKTWMNSLRIAMMNLRIELKNWRGRISKLRDRGRKLSLKSLSREYQVPKKSNLEKYNNNNYHLAGIKTFQNI